MVWSSRSPIVNRHIIFVARVAGSGAFKGAALVLAVAIIVAAWWWDASLLTAAADENLRRIKISLPVRCVATSLGEQGGKRTAHLRRRSSSLVHRGRRHRQTHHARHCSPFPPPAVKQWGRLVRPGRSPSGSPGISKSKLEEQSPSINGRQSAT